MFIFKENNGKSQTSYMSSSKHIFIFELSTFMSGIKNKVDNPFFMAILFAIC